MLHKSFLFPSYVMLLSSANKQSRREETLFFNLFLPPPPLQRHLYMLHYVFLCNMINSMTVKHNLANKVRFDFTSFLIAIFKGVCPSSAF